MIDENKSIGVFIDGGYYAKINEGFGNGRKVNLSALKTHVILLTWDPANTASTSRFLKEEVCEHYDMNTLVKAEPSLLNRLTK